MGGSGALSLGSNIPILRRSSIPEAKLKTMEEKCASKWNELPIWGGFMLDQRMGQSGVRQLGAFQQEDSVVSIEWPAISPQSATPPLPLMSTLVQFKAQHIGMWGRMFVGQIDLILG